MCEPPPASKAWLLPPGWRDHRGRGDARHLSRSDSSAAHCPPSPGHLLPTHLGIVPSALTGKAEKPGLHNVTAHLCPSVSCDRVPAHRQKYRAEYRGQGTDFSLWGKQKNLAASLDFLLTFHMLGRCWRGFVHNSIYLSEPPPCQ